MFSTNLIDLVNNPAREAEEPADALDGANRLHRQRTWASEEAAGKDFDAFIADWIGQQDFGSWIPAAILLGTTLVAIVLFALSH